MRSPQVHLLILRDPSVRANPDLTRNYERAVNDVQWFYWYELGGHSFTYEHPREVVLAMPSVVDLDWLVGTMAELEERKVIPPAPNAAIVGLAWADVYDPRAPEVVAVYLIPWRSVVLGAWVLAPAARMTERGTRMRVDHPRHRASLAVIAHELGHAFGLGDIEPAPRDNLMKWEIKTKQLFTLEDLHLTEAQKEAAKKSPLIRAFPLKPGKDGPAVSYKEWVETAALRSEAALVGSGVSEGKLLGALGVGVGIAALGALSKRESP